MKKILLIIAVVLCVAVAGTALAVTFNSASNVTGTLTADSYVNLSLEGSTTADVTIDPGTASSFTIVCTIDRSTSAASEKGNLVITLTDSEDVGISLDAVTVALYNDAAFTDPVDGASRTGAGTITVSNIDSASKTFYARIIAPAGTDVATVGGTMSLAFNRVTA